MFFGNFFFASLHGCMYVGSLYKGKCVKALILLLSWQKLAFFGNSSLFMCIYEGLLQWILTHEF